MRALTVLEGFLEKTSSTKTEANGSLPPPKSTNQTPPPKRKPRKASVRDKVFAVIRSKYATSAEIQEEAGLERKQVGGVINGPRYKKLIEKQDRGGLMAYRLVDGV